MGKKLYIFLSWHFLMSALFWKNRKKHHRAFDFGQVQTATEHFYIFQDRIQCWLNIFLAFFPETFTSSTMAIQSSITRPYLGPLKAQKKLSFVSKKKRQKLRCTKVVCYYKKQASVWNFQYYVEPYNQLKCRWNNKIISVLFSEEGCPYGLAMHCYSICWFLVVRMIWFS